MSALDPNTVTGLPNPTLRYVLTTDPLLGSNDVNDPQGPFNRELNKLLVNDLALAGSVRAVTRQTFGSVDDDAPVTLPTSPVNAPANPADGAIHTTYYNDVQAVVQYNGTGGEWVEVIRVTRVGVSGDTVYPEVTSESGAQVGVVSGTTLLGLQSVTGITGTTVLGESQSLTGSGINKVILLAGYTLTVGTGFTAGDRLVVVGDGVLNVGGFDLSLAIGSRYYYEFDGSNWQLVSLFTPPDLPSVDTDTADLEGVISADTVEAIIAANASGLVKTQETIDIDGNGYVNLTFPRTVGGTSGFLAADVVSVIGVQAATVDGDSFVNDVKNLEVRIKSGGGNMGIYWEGAAADDQVVITYIK